MLSQTMPDIPLFMGKPPRIFILLCKTHFPDLIPAIEKINTFAAGVKMELGSLYYAVLADHSAFDAYMFLIESKESEFFIPVIFVSWVSWQISFACVEQIHWSGGYIAH